MFDRYSLFGDTQRERKIGMKHAFVFALATVAMAAFGQDRVQLQSGKIVNCRVIRYVGGSFVCEMGDGATNHVGWSSVKEITFGGGEGVDIPEGTGQQYSHIKV